MTVLEIPKGGEDRAGRRAYLLVTEKNESIAAKDGKRSWGMVNRAVERLNSCSKLFDAREPDLDVIEFEEPGQSESKNRKEGTARAR